ncbi:MAG: hypothetical protein AB3N13_13080 [Arenibacterium sp.]
MTDLAEIEKLAQGMGLDLEAEDIACGDEAAFSGVVSDVEALLNTSCSGMSFGEALDIYIVTHQLLLKNANLLRERIGARMN